MRCCLVPGQADWVSPLCWGWLRQSRLRQIRGSGTKSKAGQMFEAVQGKNRETFLCWPLAWPTGHDTEHLLDYRLVGVILAALSRCVDHWKLYNDYVGKFKRVKLWSVMPNHVYCTDMLQSNRLLILWTSLVVVTLIVLHTLPPYYWEEMQLSYSTTTMLCVKIRRDVI